MKKLAFDTLELATRLQAGGVEKADVHAASLAAVITQNIYIRGEVDKMIEAALAKFDESMRRYDESLRKTNERFDDSLRKTNERFDESMRQTTAEFKDAMAKFEFDRERDNTRHEKALQELEQRIDTKFDKFENQILKIINHNFYATLGVLGALITLFGFLTTFSRYFIH